MCGLTGILHRDSRPVDETVIARMTASLNHRGPDDKGVFVSGTVGLGHTRLSVIDLSSQGHQPMVSPDGRFVLVYNGEIYNYREIRERLRVAGHRFRSTSDTEVILHACMEWGTDAFQLLEGMFAISLWDSRERILHLARDRFGIKPLYYYCSPSSAVFGSEIKSVLNCNEVPAAINWQGLREFLHYDTSLGRNTLFEGIEKLLPGYMLSIGPTGVTEKPFASILDVEPTDDDLPTATETVRMLLEEAVKRHLISDVPVGVFLSGGIDSSAITAFASKHYAGRLKTFSAGFDFDRDGSELPAARKIAEHFDTDHHELHISGGDLADVIERLVQCHDAPFGDPANIPLYLLSEELGGYHKVILQGDGGDEIFAGYPRYNQAYSRRWLYRVARLAWWARGIVPADSSLSRRLHFWHARTSSDPQIRFGLMMAWQPEQFDPTEPFSRQTRDSLDRGDHLQRYRELSNRLEHLDPVQQMLYTDCSIILPDLYFEKVDKSTMAHGIETRVPLVDTSLASYAMGLPAAYKVNGREKKYILRRALHGILPDDILNRPKHGFGVPIGQWLRSSLSGFLREVLLDPAISSSGLFDQSKLEACISQHVSGRRELGRVLYRLLTLAIWFNTYRPKLGPVDSAR